MYCDNDVGAAGATGRGEAVIQNCGGFAVVRAMERGLSPTDACLEVLSHIVKKTREKRLRNEDGEVNFDVKLYAVRKDGAYGQLDQTERAVCSVRCEWESSRELCVDLLILRVDQISGPCIGVTHMLCGHLSGRAEHHVTDQPASITTRNVRTAARLWRDHGWRRAITRKPPRIGDDRVCAVIPLMSTGSDAFDAALIAQCQTGAE